MSDHGVKILWVGHVNLKAHRNSNRMPNKNDYADALALAHYGLVHIDQPQYFVKFDPFSKQGDIRQLCLQLGHLNRVQSPIVNRLRQNLAYEFPEIAESSGDRSRGNVATLFRYIAGEKITTQSINRFEKLKAKSIGVGISQFTKYHAVRLCDIHRQEIEIETSLSMLTSCPNFDKYNKVFDEFGFGQRVRALILSTIYPMETFLGVNGKPVVEIVPNLKGTGTAKRHRSLSSFRLALGHGMVEDSSGESTDWVNGGSKLCRIALWQWIFTRIEPVKARPDTEICKELSELYDTLKLSGVPIKLVRSRVLSRAIRKMFYMLLS